MSGGEKMRRLLCAFFVVTLALGLASSAWGQAQITTATVQGDVLDEKGGSVPVATVEGKNLDTSFVRTESTATLNEIAGANTPVFGRKFEDLLQLTPGVAITQGPDGDEINFNGQRGIFNNVSLDGGDYNNGFFGEQEGGQRAAIDITLEAVKEFQVIASGANAEYGRTAGGVVNVV